MAVSATHNSVVVDVPVRIAYNQWTQFEEFPRFMGGVENAIQKGDDVVYFRVNVGGHVVEYDAKVIEQVPDRRIVWKSLSGKDNWGSVEFERLSADKTKITLHLSYEKQGVLEQVGDLLGLVSLRTQEDLQRFKTFIESRQAETGAWRGTVKDGQVMQEDDLPTEDVEIEALPEGLIETPLRGDRPDADEKRELEVDLTLSAQTQGQAASRLFEVLHRDHEEIDGLLQRVSADGGAIRALSKALTAHLDAEEGTVYQGLFGVDLLRERLSEAFDEHDQIEALLQTIDRLGPQDPSFEARLRELRDVIAHHVDIEEDEIVTIAERRLGRDELDRIAADYVEERNRILDSLEGASAASNPIDELLRAPLRKPRDV